MAESHNIDLNNRKSNPIQAGWKEPSNTNVRNLKIKVRNFQCKWKEKKKNMKKKKSKTADVDPCK